MKRRTGPALVVAAALGAAPACGGGGGRGSGPLPFDMFGATYVAMMCKSLVACHEMPDQATCEASLTPRTSWIETLQADIASGKVVYDADAAGRWASLYNMISSCKRSQYYPLIQQAGDAWNGIFKGTVAAGGACFFDEECVGGYCLPCAGACCIGTCSDLAPGIPIGGDCTNQACADSTAVCHPDAQGGTATCVAAPSTVGAACVADKNGVLHCDPSLYCDADPNTGAGTCKRGAATGTTCTSAASCDDVYDFCNPTTARCTPPLPIGAACDPNLLPSCIGYAACVGTIPTCQPAGTLGAACDATIGTFCLSPLTCDTTTFTCVLSDPAGPACM